MMADMELREEDFIFTEDDTPSIREMVMSDPIERRVAYDRKREKAMNTEPEDCDEEFDEYDTPSLREMRDEDAYEARQAEEREIEKLREEQAPATVRSARFLGETLDTSAYQEFWSDPCWAQDDPINMMSKAAV